MYAHKLSFSKACFSDETFTKLETYLLERGLRFLLPSLAAKRGVLREAVLVARKPDKAISAGPERKNKETRSWIG